jgi:catechol 2,3-dioxygenase-like lactoylglutathione lyase family enzyme
MFSHIMIGTNDVDRAKSFYDALLGTLGANPGFADGNRVFYMHDGGVLGVTKPIDGEAATHANGGTIGFRCQTPEQVHAFHDAGVAAGGRAIEDSPGWREGGFGRMYLANLRDPDGNKLCAFHRPG